MQIPPDYKITPTILKLISQIEALRLFFKSFPIPPELIIKIKRKSILKSSLYSARIEGNPLTLKDVENPEKISDRQKKLEVFNILDSVNYIEKNLIPGDNLDKEFILKLHSVIMRDLSPEAGIFRTETGAIFNQAGVAIYITPLPEKINEMFEFLLKYANTETDFPILTCVISHLIFEKIHPFLDGNGRVGRLLMSAIIKVRNYDFPISIPTEEYIDQNRMQYYFHLDHGLSETEKYIEFMLNGFRESAENLRQEVVKEIEKKEDVILPPRQEEILATIKDHVDVTFDFIKRRFIKVPERTIHYDLKILADIGLIIKVRKTRGSFYRVK